MNNLKLFLLFAFLSSAFIGTKAADAGFYVVIDDIKYSLHYEWNGDPYNYREEDLTDPLQFYHFAVVEDFMEYQLYYYIPDYIEYDGIIYEVTNLSPSAVMYQSPYVSLNCTSRIELRGCESYIRELYIRDFTGITNFNYWNLTSLSEFRVPFAAYSHIYDFSAGYGLPNIRIVNSSGRQNELYVDYHSSSPLNVVNIGPNVQRLYFDASGCQYLSQINIMALTPPDLTSDGLKLYSADDFNSIEVNVPVGKGDVYRNDPVWGQFANINECLDLKGNRISAWTEIDGIVYGVSDEDCAALYLDHKEQTYANIESSVEFYGYYYDVTRIGAAAFMNSAISSVSIPYGIREIDDLAFYGCTNLNVYLPEYLEKIGDYAFAEGPTVDTYLPSGLKWIGAGGLNGLYIPYSSNNPQPIILPEGLEYLGEQAIVSSYDVLVSIPASLKEMACHSIYNFGNFGNSEIIYVDNEASFSNLTNYSIYWPTCQQFIIPSGIKNISFYPLGSPKTVTIGKDVEVIQDRIIAEDIYMMPENPPRVWEKFVMNKPFGTVHVKKGCLANYLSDPMWGQLDNIVEDIDFADDGNFAYQLDLTLKTAKVIACHIEDSELSVPATLAHDGETFSVASIGTYAVKYHPSSIVLPETIKNIQNAAFVNGMTMSEVICYAETPPTIASFYSLVWPTLSTIFYNGKLYVPDGTLEAYRASDFGKTFNEIIELGALSINEIENVSVENGPVEIYNLEGVAVYRGNDPNVELPKGIYILKQSGQTFKLVK